MELLYIKHSLSDELLNTYLNGCLYDSIIIHAFDNLC